MNKLKIDNMNVIGEVNAPVNALQINTEAEDTSKDTQKSAGAIAEKSDTEGTKKHVVTYIGSSEYTDSTGHKWRKNNEKTYDEDEFNIREDLHFMIKYGEMKHTVVTM